nr:hypothetical protein [Catenibacterium mitsuokai]
MNKKIYLVECIDYLSEINLTIFESLEEAKSFMKGILDTVCQELKNSDESMDDWTDSDGRSKEQCIEEGKFYVDCLLYIEIVETKLGESVKISA